MLPFSPVGHILFVLLSQRYLRLNLSALLLGLFFFFLLLYIFISIIFLVFKDSFLFSNLFHFKHSILVSWMQGFSYFLIYFKNFIKI